MTDGLLTAPSSPRSGTPALRVTIAVPTFRRPERLAALLPLLLDQAREVTAGSRGRCHVDLLVVDNDPGRSAAPVVARPAAAELRYTAERVPGIAAVRNRALDECRGSDLLAFIDDDERPAPGWLAALLATWEGTRAAAVAGRVLVDAGATLDPWIEAGGFFARRRLPTGTVVAVAATSNLLLDLTQVRSAGVRFDAGLGLAGGEDDLFSRQLTGAGHRIVWCDESLVVDPVPPERTTRRWVLTRAVSHGNNAVLTELRLTRGRAARGLVRTRRSAGGALRVVAGVGRWTWGGLCRSRRHRARGLRTACRGAGMVAGACGLAYQEYGRSTRRWTPARGLAR